MVSIEGYLKPLDKEDREPKLSKSINSIEVIGYKLRKIPARSDTPEVISYKSRKILARSDTPDISTRNTIPDIPTRSATPDISTRNTIPDIPPKLLDISLITAAPFNI